MKIILVCILIILTCLFLYSVYYQPSVIFTCTTFFDFAKQDRWATFCNGIDSILKYHSPETLSRIVKWVVINEYSPNSKVDWVSMCQTRYPFIEVIQKTCKQKGQAASMNIILDTIRPYGYWIHWEETWYIEKQCFNKMMTIMDTTDITQLQITRLDDTVNWLDGPHRCLKEYCIILPTENTHKYLDECPYTMKPEFWSNWPHYSLLPSINRVSDYKYLGYFSTDPALWPIKFEWDFARRWYKAGCTKAVLPDGPAIRDSKNHKSTYTTI